MARCLRPLTIRRPGYADAPHNLPRYGRENLRPYLHDTVVVPCGKCLNCLKNRQSAMVVRCKREADKRGSFGFMTLTYDDDHLPLTRTLWRVDKETGEQSLVCEHEFVSTGYHPDKAYLDAMRALPAGPSARYLSTDLVEDSRFIYQIRVTPSVCRLDVRTWLKTARIQWKRDYGESLPDFSYVAISEYGPRTCRPHYHLAFFGLKDKHLYWLLDRWHFGNIKRVTMVNCVNSDHSSGYTRAAQYIGKYMSKGKFECDSVTECSAQKPRVCQSMGIGVSDLEPVRAQVLAFDLYGPYDPDTLCFSDGSKLSRIQTECLVKEIPRRLTYLVTPELRDSDGRVLQNEVRLPLPRFIRDRIFKNIFPNERLRQAGDACGLQASPSSKKTSLTIWSMVTAYLRDLSARESDERFRAFCADHSERTPAENAVAFAVFEEYCSGFEEATMHEDFKSFYSNSQF